MLIRSISLFVAVFLLETRVHAQNVQTNNQGVIVNVVAPAYPLKTDGQLLGEYLDSHPRPTVDLAQDLVSNRNRAEMEYRLAHPAPVVAQPVYYVTTEDTNLLAGCHTNYTFMQHLPKGSYVTLAPTTGEDCLRVFYPKTQQYGIIHCELKLLHP